MAPKSKKPAPAPVPDFDIDLSAALPPAPPAPAPKKGRGRPRSAAPKPPRKYKIRKDKGIPKKKIEPQPALIDIYNINIGDRDIDINKGEQSAVVNLKEKLTAKELKFIEIYFQGNISQEKAMDLAGYGDLHPTYKRKLACSLIAKHETQTQDHRIICRAMGAGEVFIIKTLYSLAKDSKSEKIRLEATMNLAKILGITKEQVDDAGGITIIFEQPDAPGQPAARSLPSQDTEQPKPVTYQQPVRVLQITK